MVVHQHEGMHFHAEPLLEIADEPEEDRPLGIVSEDRPATGTSMHHVVPCTLEIDSSHSSHDRRFCRWGVTSDPVAPTHIPTTPSPRVSDTVPTCV